jgi:site-specific recombinase XerD
MAKLLYGSGLRVTECVRLRVKHRETAAAEETLGMCRLTYNFLDIKKRMPLHGTSPRRGLEHFGRPAVGRTGLK